MRHPRVLALILAGGKGSRLELLTDHRAKPSLPFAGTVRLIDIPLSNLMHSHISDVWLVEQYRPHSLNDHLANGRPWDLDRTHGGLRVLPPYEGSDSEGFARGNTDALYRQVAFIREFAPDLVLVLSADHLYRLDYRDLVAEHLARQADMTMVVTEVSRQAAQRGGVVEVRDGRVTGFDYKPERPKTNRVTAEVFLYNAHTLLETLEALSSEGDLQDYGHDLVPRFVAQRKVHAFALQGYWRDVGTVESYWEAHMDVIAGNSLAFDDPVWPILTAGHQRLPARFQAGAQVSESLIAPGCVIAGHVSGSVLSPGVVVEAGAVVRDSVLLGDAVVASGAVLTRAIVDKGAVIGRGARVGEDKGELTLLGRDVCIAPDAHIEPGARVAAREPE
jgi:glucose-1-phosphate adenylyltransferase